MATIEDLQAEIDRLTIENKQLKIDARRYLWLRSSSQIRTRRAGEEYSIKGENLDKEIDKYLKRA